MLLMSHTDVNHVFPSCVIKLIIYFTYFSLALSNLKSASHIYLRHYHSKNLLNIFPWSIIIFKIWLTYFPRAIPNLESASRIHCSMVWSETLWHAKLSTKICPGTDTVRRCYKNPASFMEIHPAYIRKVS